MPANRAGFLSPLGLALTKGNEHLEVLGDETTHTTSNNVPGETVLPTRRRFLTATGSVVVLAGCAGGNTETPAREGGDDDRPTGPEDADAHVLTDYSSQSWQEEWYDRLVPGFRSRGGGSVYIGYPPDSVRARFEQLLQEGDPPEVVTGTLGGFGDHVISDRILSVDDLVSDLVAANGDLLDPGSTRVDGSAHLVPHGLSMSTFNYRADIYDELELSVPETWDELRENARAIERSDATDARGFAVPLVPTDSLFPPNRAEALFTTLLYSAGGDYWRWVNEAANELEVDFRPRHVRPVLELLRDLARYSPSPSGLDLSSLIQKWNGGAIAQCFMSNAWLCGLAHRLADARDVALATRQAPPPRRDRTVNPERRGWLHTDGMLIVRGAENTDIAEAFLRYMYEGRSEQASRNLVEPMRWLPPYEGVMDTDRYRNGTLFQVDDGYFLERNRYCRNEIYPFLAGDRPQNAATRYARQGGAVAEMVTAVVADGVPIAEAISDARDRLRARLQEGRERMN